MHTQVINMQNAPSGWRNNPDYVYVGRTPEGKAGEWGNPFTAAEFGRDTACERYAEWIQQPLQSVKRKKIREQLQGKILVCFCHPERCHAHIIACVADSQE